MNVFLTVLSAAGIPSLISGLMLWEMKRKIEKTEKKREQHQQRQEALQTIILESVNGSIRLGEATARAVQRIPDAHCNGDMHQALDDIAETKRRQQRMLMEAGVRGIME